jgi:hypothetical protein
MWIKIGTSRIPNVYHMKNHIMSNLRALICYFKCYNIFIYIFGQTSHLLTYRKHIHRVSSHARRQ